MVDNGGGTISASGLFTAGSATGTFTDTIVASLVGVRGTATVEVMPRILHHFDIATVASPQHAGVPFGVSITARDMDGLVVTGYNGTASLYDLAGPVSPGTATFTNGTWTGTVTIGSARSGDRLIAADGYPYGQSNTFDVTAASAAVQPVGCDPRPAASGTPMIHSPWSSARASVRRWTAQVTGLRFFKDAGNNSAHVGHLWTNTGTLLATAAFTNETAIGLADGAAERAGQLSTKDTSYVVSYHTITLSQDRGVLRLSEPHQRTPHGAKEWRPDRHPRANRKRPLRVRHQRRPSRTTRTWRPTTGPTSCSRRRRRTRLPVAVDDTYTTDEDTSLVLDATVDGTNDSPVDNDTDADGDPLTVTAVSNAAGGTVSLVAGTITFVPTANLCEPGAYGFDYTVSDGKLTDTGHADVTITCVDDAPVAIDDTKSMLEDATATAIDVLANDTDVDDGPWPSPRSPSRPTAPSS